MLKGAVEMQNLLTRQLPDGYTRVVCIYRREKTPKVDAF